MSVITFSRYCTSSRKRIKLSKPAFPALPRLLPECLAPSMSNEALPKTRSYSKLCAPGKLCSGLQKAVYLNVSVCVCVAGLFQESTGKNRNLRTFALCYWIIIPCWRLFCEREYAGQAACPRRDSKPRLLRNNALRATAATSSPSWSVSNFKPASNRQHNILNIHPFINER